MRRALICANWKMNHTLSDGIAFMESMASNPPAKSDMDIVIFPSFPLIHPLKEICAKTGFQIGAQNLNENSSGAYTGEVSADILKSSGADWVIIGHSERREIFNETDELIREKISAALSVNLNIILCVGEKLDTRNAGRAIDVVKTQLEIDMNGLKENDVKMISIAYEPIWAIGTGLASNPDDAQEMMKFIRDWITDNFGNVLAENMRILYGGSVKADNMSGYSSMPDIDGALIGGASLDADSFRAIIQSA